MAATFERASFVSQEFRAVKNGPVSGVVAKYGENARKGKEVIPTFFETQGDAQAIGSERMTLLSADRRRFQQMISGEATGLSINYLAGAPTVTVIDDDRAANNAGIISQIDIDFANETTKIESWG